MKTLTETLLSGRSAENFSLTIAEKSGELQAPRPGLEEGLGRALDWLYRKQEDDGFWVGMLESNSCMEAEWILAMHFLGLRDEKRCEKIARSILNEQRPDGSWEVYHHAPSGDINTTVECYAALRAMGHDRDSEPIRKAREWIFAHGGLKGIRNFTKYWLALIGEWPWDGTPTMPPELIYLPMWMPFNIYRFASWVRGTLVPLCILSARCPSRPLPARARLDELFPGGRDRFDYRLPRKGSWASWEGIFHMADRVLRRYFPFRGRRTREIAIKICIEWIIRHQEADGVWSGIQPPWVYSLMALNVEGYGLEHPVLKSGLDALDRHWSYEKDGGIYVQASESPVWDTVLSMLALLDSGQTPATCPSLTSSLRWLLKQQIRAWGDWSTYIRDVRGGGWAFQRANQCYPDVDDTSVALIVLARLRPLLSDPTEVDHAIELATEWMLGMQCSNGGWAAYDRDNDTRLLTKIPFCDFGELLDPPSVDVTAHVAEALACLGRGMGDLAVARAVRFIRQEQESDGSWFGRWGVNHIYGTGAVLPALRAVGEDMSSRYVRRAADWVAHHQNHDGGWGETPASYMDDSMRGVGESTASQTAWALMALMAVEHPCYDEAIIQGVEYLLSSQQAGTWSEPQYTGTGFPGYSVGGRVNLKEKAASIDQGHELQRGFMINYNLYRHYFPVMALGRARRYFQRKWDAAKAKKL
ncbi:MAG: squalene--hopene cyclase [Verrucomicrobiae bacterium]|nr:squalene--hopene cyclase [Verrucomicrobiae bacterium]